MGAKTDQDQNFSSGWILPGEPELMINDSGFPDNSPEAKYWPLYRDLFTAISQHNDVKSLQWHRHCLRLLNQNIGEMICEIDNE